MSGRVIPALLLVVLGACGGAGTSVAVNDEMGAVVVDPERRDLWTCDVWTEYDNPAALHADIGRRQGITGFRWPGEPTSLPDSAGWARILELGPSEQ